MHNLLKPLQDLMNPRGIRRILMTVFGVTICGFGVSMSRMAAFGVDPFQCLCSGIYQNIPVSQGTLYVIINAIFLIFALIFDRKQIGLGTFINMFLLGYVCDFGERLFRNVFGSPDLVGQFIWLALSILVLCLASSLYMTSALGVSTYDFVAIHLSNRGILPFRYMRIVCDVICVAAGWLLGYIPGLATIIFALMMGPLISFFNKHIAEPILNGTLFIKA